MIAACPACGENEGCHFRLYGLVRVSRLEGINVTSYPGMGTLGSRCTFRCLLRLDTLWRGEQHNNVFSPEFTTAVMTPFSSQQPCRVALLTMTGTPFFVRRVNTQLVHSFFPSLLLCYPVPTPCRIPRKSIGLPRTEYLHFPSGSLRLSDTYSETESGVHEKLPPRQAGGTCPLALAAERILPREVLVPKASRTIAEGNQFSSNVTETYVRKPTGGAEHCRHARLRC